MVAPALMALLPSLIQAGASMYGANKQKEATDEGNLLNMIGGMNPAQNLQGMQSGFGMPNMQSVNGLLGR
jgi:hypothetical protein